MFRSTFRIVLSARRNRGHFRVTTSLSRYSRGRLDDGERGSAWPRRECDSHRFIVTIVSASNQTVCFVRTGSTRARTDRGRRNERSHESCGGEGRGDPDNRRSPADVGALPPDPATTSRCTLDRPASASPPGTTRPDGAGEHAYGSRSSCSGNESRPPPMLRPGEPVSLCPTARRNRGDDGPFRRIRHDCAPWIHWDRSRAARSTAAKRRRAGRLLAPGRCSTSTRA